MSTGNEEAVGRAMAWLAEAPAPEPGGVSLVLALGGALASLDRSLSHDAAIVLSGVGLRAYDFDPSDNWKWEELNRGERFRWDSLDADSYGVAESLAGHAGVDIRRCGRLRRADVWRVVSHEVGEGRVLVAMLPGEPPCTILVTGMEGSGRDSRTLDTVGLAPPAATKGLPDRGDLRAEGPFIEVITVRPGGAPPGTSLRRALARDVLRWALRHGHSRREIMHEREAWYGAGLAAVESLERRWASAREQAEWEYARTALRALALGRGSASRWMLGQARGGRGVRDCDAVGAWTEAEREALALVASAYAKVASEAGRMGSAREPEAQAPGHLASLETAALGSLAALIQAMPG